MSSSGFLQLLNWLHTAPSFSPVKCHLPLILHIAWTDNIVCLVGFMHTNLQHFFPGFMAHGKETNFINQAYALCSIFRWDEVNNNIDTRLQKDKIYKSEISNRRRTCPDLGKQGICIRYQPIDLSLPIHVVWFTAYSPRRFSQESECFLYMTTHPSSSNPPPQYLHKTTVPK